VKLMGSVGRNVQRLASAHDRLLATKGRFHLAFEQDKGLLEVMPMRRRPASRRDVHIDNAEASIGLLARHGDGVGIADQTDVRKVVGLRQRETAAGLSGGSAGRAVDICFSCLECSVSF
jgi:hypothetical protein